MSGEKEKSGKKESAAVVDSLAVIDVIGDGLVLHGMDGRILAANPALEKMFGVEKSKLIGKDVAKVMSKFIKSEDMERAKGILKTSMEGKVPTSAPLTLVGKDGQEVSVIFTASLVKDAEGKPVQVVVMFKDITEHKRMGMELVDQRDLLKSILNGIPISVYCKDKDARFVQVSGGYRTRYEVYGKKYGLKLPENLIGKTDFDIFLNEHAKEMFEDDMRVIKKGEPIIDKLEHFTTPDGIEQYTITTKVPRFDEEGNIIGLVGVSLDVTKRMLTEEKLHRAYAELKSLDKMKDEFLCATSHELKTPLTSMVSLVRFLLDDKLGKLTEQQREYLELVSEDTKRLRDSIDKVLEISRLESGKMKLKMKNLQLADLIRDTVEKMEPLAKQKRITLIQKITKLPLISGDETQLAGVMTNLIDNAIKFTPEEGKVSIEAKRKKDHILVRVRDTGIGIASKNIPQLLIKFFQVDHSTPGAGLGLGICKMTVEAHGGKIWAKGKVGRGSTFSFTLPMKSSPKGA